MRLVSGAALVLLLAACGAGATRGSPPGSPDTMGPTPTPGAVDITGAWVLEEGIVRDDPTPILDGHRITLTVEGPVVGGVSACNHYGGRIRITGDQIRFSAIGGTEMGCLEDVMAAEALYLSALGLVETVAREGDRLSLSGPAADLRFGLLSPVPQAALVDTEWSLESLVHGDAVSSVAAPSTLRLGSDGSLRGSTGCRELTGRYVIAGDTIQSVEMAADGECDRGLSEQDSHVISVLEGPYTAHVEGETLTLTGSGNEGLVYRRTVSDEP